MLTTASASARMRFAAGRMLGRIICTVTKRTARVLAGGRVAIPAEIREAVGLREGDDVYVEVGREGDIRLIPVADALARAQDLLAPYVAAGPSLADELIAERRAEISGD